MKTILLSIFGAWLFLWASPGMAQVTISNVTYASGQTVTVMNTTTINAGPNVLVSSGANVTFLGGSVITLLPGFHAASGSLFQALINGSVPGLQDTGASATSLSFSWQAYNGSGTVSYYNVYRNGTFLGSTSSLSFSDASLSANTPFLYLVTAISTAGEPVGSSSLTIYTQGPTGSLPAGAQLVLITPSGQYFGIASGTWAISSTSP
jgi:hypothetical protein